MEGVLNETTLTVHRRKAGASGPRSQCGLTYHLSPDKLHVVSIETVSSNADVTKCGCCFEDAGGY